MPFDVFPKVEVDFFNLIKENVKVIFDIGSRDDIDYIKNSYDKSREFHLFEPDVKFLSSCQKQIELLEPSEKIENSIYLNPFGLGSEEGNLTYYPNTQSFVFRTYLATSQDVGITFPIRTLDNYCLEKSIQKIDFLKVDIEGMEIDVFNGGKKFINDFTDIIQFEFGSCMLDRNISPEELIGWFDRDKFDIFLQRVDPRHPFYKENNQLLTPLTNGLFNRIKKDMIEGSGCNMVAIRKNISKRIYDNILKEYNS